MRKRCDLHTHSTCSDGTVTPAELVRLAEDLGLAALALTDHNTARGLAEFMAAGAESSVITVPGCEFTTDYRGTELHVVGLFFREEVWPEIEDYVELMHMAKRNSNRKMLAALTRDGYSLTYREVTDLAGSEDFNRSHVARVMVGKGYVQSVKEAFDTLLKEGNGYYIPAQRLSALATIRFIKAYGGTAVLAHPFLNLNEEELIEFLPKAKAAGLDAIETRYTEFDRETTRKAEALALRFGLKQSGGSDFHGTAKPNIALGTGWGDLEVPFSFYEDLAPREDNGGTP